MYIEKETAYLLNGELVLSFTKILHKLKCWILGHCVIKIKWIIYQIPLCFPFLLQDEIFDMVKPKDPLKISLQDLINSNQGDTVTTILIDLNGFWTYENREALVANDNENSADLDDTWSQKLDCIHEHKLECCMENLWSRILRNGLNKRFQMPIEHSKCSHYWINSLETIGPN